MTMSFGVAAGATNMPQPAASKPGTPASAIVGISGAVGQRVSDETPSARTFPAWIWGSEGSGSENRTWMCPPMLWVERATRVAAHERRCGRIDPIPNDRLVFGLVEALRPPDG